MSDTTEIVRSLAALESIARESSRIHERLTEISQTLRLICKELSVQRNGSAAGGGQSRDRTMVE